MKASFDLMWPLVSVSKLTSATYRLKGEVPFDNIQITMHTSTQPESKLTLSVPRFQPNNSLMFELERHLNEKGQTEQERVECLRGQEESEKFKKKHIQGLYCVFCMRRSS